MKTCRRIAMILGAVLLAVAGGAAQDSTYRPPGSLGLRGGLSWPLGSWAASRINPNVNFFIQGGTFDADIELNIGKRLTLALAGGYSNLNGSDWEEYVASKGGSVKVTASAFHLALLLRPHVLVTRTDLLRIELGPAILWPKGSETYQGRSYSYDFLQSSSWGVRGGVEYTRFLTETFGVSICAAVLVFPSGVKYLSSETQSYVSLPITVGFRVAF